MTDRHYTEPVDEISGTVESASPGGITLKEYPGRRFQFSSVSDQCGRHVGAHSGREERYDQVSPSCRAHNTSRARAGSSLPLTGSSPAMTGCFTNHALCLELSVLPETQHLARLRRKLPAAAHMLTASQDFSFINHALASSLCPTLSIGPLQPDRVVRHGVTIDDVGSCGH